MNLLRSGESIERDDAPIGASAWRALSVLTAVYTLHYIDRSIMGILIEPVKAEFALTDGQLGILTGLGYSVLYALAGLILGYFIDRTHRRNLLAFLLLCWSGATALCGLAQNYWSLLAARSAVGVAESGAAPTAMSMISDIFPARRRATAIGMFWASTTIGLAIAASVGGYVASNFGWRMAFFVAGVPGLLMIPVLLLLVREPVRGAQDAGQSDVENAPTLAEAWRGMTGNPVYVFSFLGMITNSAAGSGLITWAPSFFVRVHGLTLFQAGLVLAVAALCMGSLGAFAGGALGDRLFRRSGNAGLALTPAISAMATFAVSVLLLVGTAAWLAIAAWMLWEFAYRSYFGAGNTMLLVSVEPRMRGVAGSTSSAITNLLGFGLGSTTIGVISDRVGGAHSLQWGMAAVLGFYLLTALTFALAARAVRRQGGPLRINLQAATQGAG